MGGLVLSLLAGTIALPATGCSPESTSRDLHDATPPALLLTVTASKSADGGRETVRFGGRDMELTEPGGTVSATAADDDGVSYVELWMTEARDCGGEQVGPGLPGAPTKRVEGQATASAPTSLSVSYAIDTAPLKANCTYTFDVWARAANAAITPVNVESPATRLRLRT